MNAAPAYPRGAVATLAHLRRVSGPGATLYLVLGTGPGVHAVQLVEQPQHEQWQFTTAGGGGLLHAGQLGLCTHRPATGYVFLSKRRAEAFAAAPAWPAPAGTATGRLQGAEPPMQNLKPPAPEPGSAADKLIRRMEEMRQEAKDSLLLPKVVPRHNTYGELYQDYKIVTYKTDGFTKWIKNT